MADYWKSNPRHFCKFCKCWIADNKPSRDFHEKGKNHQQNVQRKIMEVRKSSYKAAEAKDAENSYLEEMEKGAKAAFLKDLKSDPKLAAQYLQKAAERKKAAEAKKVKEGAKSGATTSSSSTASSEGSETNKEATDQVYKGTWRITHSPEGYPYYWNDVTAEVSWTLPEGIDAADIETIGDATAEQPSQASEEADKPSGKETSSSSSDEDEEKEGNENRVESKNETESEDDAGSDVEGTTNDGDSTDAMKDDNNAVQPSEPVHIDPSDISSIPLPGAIIPPKPTSQTVAPPGFSTSDTVVPPGGSQLEEAVPNSGEELGDIAARNMKRAHDSAYGTWESVPEEQEEQIDLELPETSSNVEEKVVVISEPKLKFREKKVNSLGADLVAFKKRKMNSRNLKQRGDS